VYLPHKASQSHIRLLHQIRVGSNVYRYDRHDGTKYNLTVVFPYTEPCYVYENWAAHILTEDEIKTRFPQYLEAHNGSLTVDC
jgi:hypothetical protein